MAASWISGMIASGVQTAIQPAVASAGSFAGGAVSSVGAGVNGAGEYVNGYVRRYGNGIQDYGNAIRDWTAAEGSRSQTAANPLGLSSNKVGGKQGVVNPKLDSRMVSSAKFDSPAASRLTATNSKTVSQIHLRGGKGTTAVKGSSVKKSDIEVAKPTMPKKAGRQTTGKSNATAAQGVRRAGRPGNEGESRKVSVSPESSPRNLNKSTGKTPGSSAVKMSTASPKAY